METLTVHEISVGAAHAAFAHLLFGADGEASAESMS